MRIGRQAPARFELAAEVFKLFLRKPPFKKCPSVNTRRSVTLKIDDVARVVAGLAAKEMVEPHLVECGGAGVG